MKHLLIIGVALAAAFTSTATGRAQTKTDFSGTWTFDQAKSDPPPSRGGRGGGRGGGGGVPLTLTISQTASQITIDRILPPGPAGRGATTAMTSGVYKLDGSESTNALGDVFLSRSKAVWDGGNLVIATVKDMGLGPNGQMSEDVKEVFSLVDGVLTVTSTTRNTPAPPGAEQTRRLVYIKKM